MRGDGSQNYGGKQTRGSGSARVAKEARHVYLCIKKKKKVKNTNPHTRMFFEEYIRAFHLEQNNNLMNPSYKSCTGRPRPQVQSGRRTKFPEPLLSSGGASPHQ
jgi:hypothetical protein